ncbi:hypothetical protein [Streptomyces sp. Ag109_O5-10]|uniref:hypothetical protein n=1 Tax=Streptomyces sp. Ag109_O5-10 TaxID=1855349 RepID=UPI000896AC60|nr:hypothetical protein [Streptomyces sp. Ag109_O5-10]SEF16638.1 hypothetical protein SAMN05216533_7907 [Streptomyces sp. Ag109_O5-10]
MALSTGTATERERQRPAVAEQAPEPNRGAHRPPVKAWLQPVLISLIVVAAFIACYVGLQRDPQPHRVPIAVTGPSLPGEIQRALGDAVEVHPAADAATARHALERYDVVAVLDAAAPGHLNLQIAGAAGVSTTSAVSRLVDAYAQGAGAHMTTADVVPPVEHDARGLAGFYVAFGVSLAGFVLGSNVLGLAGVMHLRHRYFLLAGASAAIGTVGAIVVGPVLGAAPAPLVPLVFVLALLAAATAFTTKLLGALLGPIGLPITTLVLLTVGNATSGAVVGADLLPSWARTVSALLPPGAAVRGIADLSYDNGSHLAGPVLTLALWAIAAGFLLSLRPRLMRRRAAVA